MKTIYSLIILAVCTFAIVSCDEDDHWNGSPDWVHGGGNNQGGTQGGNTGGNQGGNEQGSTTDQSTIITKLSAQWSGVLRDSFYYEAYALTGDGYATVIEFASNGDGVQLDYEVAAPTESYSYVPFTWTVGSNNAIQLTYADNFLPAATVSQYQLTDDKFNGTITYGNTYTYPFEFAHIYAFDWSPYYSASASSAKSISGVSITGKIIQCGKFAEAKSNLK